MNYAQGIQKRIRRWAKVDPSWAEWIGLHSKCEAEGCGVETARFDGVTVRPTDRIYVCLDSSKPLSPENVRCLCRKHAGQ